MQRRVTALWNCLNAFNVIVEFCSAGEVLFNGPLSEKGMEC